MARTSKKLSTGPQTDDLFRIGSGETVHPVAPPPTPEPAPEAFDQFDADTPVVRKRAVMRKPKPDLFFVDPQLEVILKSEVQSMEHPVYSLSKTPDFGVAKYEHNGNWLEITPSIKGRATIYDKDVLLYVTSHLVRAINEGKPVSPYVRLTAHDFLRFAQRGSGGKSYELLRDSFTRLSGTRIQTNIKTAETEEFTSFGIIENAKIVRETREGRMLEVELKLSDWVFSAIDTSQVLTLHPDYFRLRRPLERRLYELARKHCGYQPRWQISIEHCMKKAGSKGPLKEFRRALREIVAESSVNEHFPDYTVEIDGDNLVFSRKAGSKLVARPKAVAKSRPALKSDTYDKARKVAPGLDVYALEQDWISFWETNGKPAFNSPDAAFIGFCKSRASSR